MLPIIPILGLVVWVLHVSDKDDKQETGQNDKLETKNGSSNHERNVKTGSNDRANSSRDLPSTADPQRGDRQLNNPDDDQETDEAETDKPDDVETGDQETVDQDNEQT